MRVWPGATIWTLAAATAGAGVAGTLAATAGLWRGMMIRCPGRMAAGPLKLFACRMAPTGTPYLRARLSTVSPCPTMTAVPPLRVQPGWVGRATDPVTSWLAATRGGRAAGAGAGLYDPMPCPPPETPVDAMVAGWLAFGGGGKGCAEIWLVEGADRTEPVTSAGAAVRAA